MVSTDEVTAGRKGKVVWHAVGLHDELPVGTESDYLSIGKGELSLSNAHHQVGQSFIEVSFKHCPSGFLLGKLLEILSEDTFPPEPFLEAPHQIFFF